MRLNSSFVVPLTDKPRTLYIGARQRNGIWFSNKEIQLPAAAR
jgi:hypothetical protein